MQNPVSASCHFSTEHRLSQKKKIDSKHSVETILDTVVQPATFELVNCHYKDFGGYDMMAGKLRTIAIERDRPASGEEK